jgi:hypothetical protein
MMAFLSCGVGAGMTLSQGSGIYSECTKFLPFFIISAVWSKSRGEEGRWNHYLILLCRYEKIAERSLAAGPVTVNTMKISIYAEKKGHCDEKETCTGIGDDSDAEPVWMRR